jgi:glycosyltransferase involved in cell wall biosynthesis
MESAACISVVIPLFNKGNCIGRTIQSVLDQTVPCREIVVVDDGSTDGGHGVVERIQDDRMRLYEQTNQGPSAARNRGIAETQGELITFLDADDEWKPWFLELILHLRTRCPHAGAYATACEIHEPDGHVWMPSFREIPPAPWEGVIPNYFRSAIGDGPVWTSAVVVPREVLDTVGSFALCNGVGEDAELWARIALRYPIAFSRRVGATYHREAENRCCETVFTHAFTTGCFERAVQSQTVPSCILPDVREFLAHQKLVAASRYIMSGQSEIARVVLRDCKTRRFLRHKLWWWFWSMLPSGCVHLAWHIKRWLRGCWRRVAKDGPVSLVGDGYATPHRSDCEM